MTRTRLAVLAAGLLLACSAVAQGPATGRLLVSTPLVADPEFAESVLLLVHHGEDGSLAVMLNRPTWVDPADAFPDVPVLAGFRGRLFLGGPIAPAQLLVLVRRSGSTAAETTPVTDDVHISTDLGIFEETAYSRAPESEIRLFAGHAAWAPGRLDAEIEAGGWRVLPMRSDLIFDSRPRDLWDAVADIAEAEFTAQLTAR